jgi:uncharacterized protein YggU (UPF0235/DUF167 family)
LARTETDLSALAEPGRTFLVRVTPGARAASVTPDGDIIRISVNARAVDGAATEAARDALARSLGVAKTRLTLLRGATSREKLFRLD